MRPLKSMVGEIIMARIPALDKEEMVLVTLHMVEASGIWVESQDFTETIMCRCEIAASRTTVLMFATLPSATDSSCIWEPSQTDALSA
jgi:hypothetical protein